jgi:hypothetical protein
MAIHKSKIDKFTDKGIYCQNFFIVGIPAPAAIRKRSLS